MIGESHSAEMLRDSQIHFGFRRRSRHSAQRQGFAGGLLRIREDLFARGEARAIAFRSSVEHFEKAVALDPDYDWAHHVLGRWHYEVAELGGTKRLVVRLFFP